MIVLCSRSLSNQSRIQMMTLLAEAGIREPPTMVETTRGIAYCLASKYIGAAVEASLSMLPEVSHILSIPTSYQLASREFIDRKSIISIGDPSATEVVHLGADRPVIIAGPCAIEDAHQVRTIARAVKSAGAHMLRGGAFKPRSSPYTFQGLGVAGLKLLAEARAETGLPIITEVMEPSLVDEVAAYADVLQIGCRNMQNFPLLQAAGHTQRPVLLKRGFSATIEEWLQAAEYILSAGNPNVILCERGIRSFDPLTRNLLDLSCVPLLKTLTHLPLIVDPSHSTGKRQLVAPMAHAAIAAGADGLLVDVHHQPDQALCDGDQAILPGELERLVQRVHTLHQALFQATIEVA